MILAANPEVEFPGKMGQRARVLAEVEVEEAFVLSELENATGVTLATDAWTTATTMLPFLAIAAHWVSDEWKCKTILIAFRRLQGHHTGEHMAAIVIEVIEKFKLSDKASFYSFSSCFLLLY